MALEDLDPTFPEKYVYIIHIHHQITAMFGASRAYHSHYTILLHGALQIVPELQRKEMTWDSSTREDVVNHHVKLGQVLARFQLSFPIPDEPTGILQEQPPFTRVGHTKVRSRGIVDSRVDLHDCGLESMTPQCRGCNTC